MSVILNPSHLLELHIISAQDLENVSRSIRPYAITWIHPDKKMSTRIDNHGRNNPTWNDRFVFKVDQEFLRSNTSAITIEIYSSHWLKDILLGSVRVIVGNLLPHMGSRPVSRRRNVGMQFAALLVRRPSGRPQGIINVGVTLINTSRKSTPLYSEISTSVTLTNSDNPNEPRSIVDGGNHGKPSDGGAILKPMLMRSKSESRSMEAATGGNKLKRNVSSRERLHSSQDQKLPKGSMVNGYYYVSHPNENAKPDKSGESVIDSIAHGSRSGAVKVTELNEGMMSVDLRDLATGRTGPKPDMSLSASQVVMSAASKKTVPYRAVAMEGSIVTVSDSIEGLHSKLERWRMELPTIYAKSDVSSKISSAGEGEGKAHGRRHSDGGLFSCFTNICGCECSIVCGGNVSVNVNDTSPLKSRRRPRRHSHSPHSDSFLL